MRISNKGQPSRWQSFFEFSSAFFSTFWPILATPVVLVSTVHFHQPWIGMVIFGSIGLAHKWWWTCIFGLLNAAAIVAGFLACAGAVIQG